MRVGLAEIYRELVGLRTAVDRLASLVQSGTEELADHEARLRALERRSWPLPSLAALISIAALVLTLLRK